MKKPQKLLRDIFGFDEFRLGQREIIDAVSSKKNVLAMQCHVEMTSFLVNDWSESWKNYLETSKKGIQNFDQIKASLDKKIELLNRTADVLYGKWVSKLYENQTA